MTYSIKNEGNKPITVTDLFNHDAATHIKDEPKTFIIDPDEEMMFISIPGVSRIVRDQ